MSVYLSEGYDSHYEQKTCVLSDFAATMRQTLLAEDVVPSTRMSIVRDAKIDEPSGQA
jgi:hypothetical protein